ncbi:hypothetical protein A0128_18895 [Leptospira tipperaryensis]|uniref:Uncharacterized protein n=1 Tax=Leptospira tipperaryensis TaxID=2564040 RepID=A0A1D7V1N2_9LEPT|nr:hypothetical protein A0128_18895 [Leptospira tipperaryensis]
MSFSIFYFWEEAESEEEKFKKLCAAILLQNGLKVRFKEFLREYLVCRNKWTFLFLVAKELKLSSKVNVKN